VPRSSGVWQWIKKMRGHWVIFPGRSDGFEVLPWHFWLGDRKGVHPIKNQCHSSTKFLYWNKWSEKWKTAEPANRGLPGKHPVKWKQRWFIFIVYVLLDCTSSLVSDTSCCHYEFICRWVVEGAQVEAESKLATSLWELPENNPGVLRCCKCCYMDSPWSRCNVLC